MLSYYYEVDNIFIIKIGVKMYNIIFYQDRNGKSEIFKFMKELDKKALTSKNERIMLKQLRLHINILESLGTRAGKPFVKYIQDDIWEIRPGNNRVLFFVWIDNNIVLLHHFRKKTNKTPKSEILKAINKMKDWKERNVE
jgi:phage-related protein